MKAHLLIPDEDFPRDAVLEMIHRRLERANRNRRANLSAWAGILDSLGWCVALRVPDQPPALSENASAWLARRGGAIADWENLAAVLEGSPNLERFISLDEIHVWQDMARVAPKPSEDSALVSKREAEVLGWLRQGKTGPEIAVILGRSRRTVESHISSIYRKLGIHRRNEVFFHLPSPDDDALPRS